MSDEPRRMVFAHDYLTGKDVIFDPDAVVVARRLKALPTTRERKEEVPERTLIVIGREAETDGRSLGPWDTFLVKEHPSQIAFHARWKMTQAASGSGPPPTD